MIKDPYREWTYNDRTEAYRNRDYEGCRKYDNDFASSDRAYENWKSGGDFSDPDSEGRFH